MSPFERAVSNTPADRSGCDCRLLPRPRGTASALGLSGPARTSLRLRPAELLNRPRRPLSRGSSPASYPAKPLVSYRSKSTTLRVAPAATGHTRPRGALHKFRTATRACRRCECIAICWRRRWQLRVIFDVVDRGCRSTGVRCTTNSDQKVNAGPPVVMGQRTKSLRDSPLTRVLEPIGR